MEKTGDTSVARISPFSGEEVGIFVHGCFWHRCPKCNLSHPKSNVDYWGQKFEKNVERDRRKEKALLDSDGMCIRYGSAK